MEDNSSSDEEHPWVKFGNPLQEIEETTKKPTSTKIHEQIVTDEEGRRRFHGAFTGGFSAGYYNTVGSKGGWTPSTFKSSRDQKSKKNFFQPEDFMDDEDKSDHGIAPHSVQTHDDFKIGQKRSQMEQKQLSIREERMTLGLGAGLIDSLLAPARTNIGVKLLRKLGWKEGQGVGPRVVKDLEKVYGCQPSGWGQQNEDKETSEPIHFAPKDTTPISLTPKTDLHGIGYSGIIPTHALHTKVKQTKTLKLRTKSGGKLSFQGQAFGVGAYEEEDEDIYSQETMNNYDVIMGGESVQEENYGWTKPLAITGASHKESIEYKTGALSGFTPAKLTKSRRKTYPAPLLPPNFDPLRRLKLREGVERIKELGLEKNGDKILPKGPQSSRSSIEERGKVLGEKFSVFDLISNEDKLRLKEARNKPKELGFKRSENKEKTPTPPAPVTKPVDPKSMRPFANNPNKQQRFEQFEQAVKKGNKDPYSTIKSDLTEWEKTKEREEFRKVNKFYQHFSGDISSRFTKAQDDNEDNKIKQETTSGSVFGTITRDKLEWHPDPLLCKRFNVPDPYPKSDIVGIIKFNSTKMSIFDNFPKLQTQPTERNPETPSNKPPSVTSQGKEDKQTIKTEVEPLPIIHTKAERPPLELFKSIFESDDNSDSDDDKNIEKEESNKELVVKNADTIPQRTNAAEIFKNPISNNKNIQHIFNKPKKKTDPEDENKTVNEETEITEIKHVFNKPRKKDGSREKVTMPTEESSVTMATGEDSVTMATQDDEDFFGPLPPPKLPQATNSDTIKLHKSHKKHKKHKKKDKKRKKEK